MALTGIGSTTFAVIASLVGSIIIIVVNIEDFGSR
jgi:hypothetical protein